uniref:non-specific serine/threonine protein kinase n=1 Tax=Kalanchoe fedtschenkoi TaxID=63787 RepID=A0A7N0R9B8_KALFE
MRIQIANSIFEFPQHPLLLALILAQFSVFATGFGSMGPIAAAFGEDHGFFCAIDAGGRQEVVCWGKNSSSVPKEKGSAYFNDVPPMAGLSGGEGFLCGILANTSLAYCWSLAGLGNGNSLVPRMFSNTGYSHIAAGKSHVCAIRGSYYSDNDSGTVDCWDIVTHSNGSLSAAESVSFYNQSISNNVFRLVVSGDGFSCGGVREGGVVCWGPTASNLGVAEEDSTDYSAFASGRSSVCGIAKKSGEIKCWGDNISFDSIPVGIPLVGLAAGAHHFCGIREDNHGVECWGKFASSTVPKRSGFMAIASSDYTTCGIREEDLVLDCWYADVSLSQGYEPPLQLCSPGLCSPVSCGVGTYVFNASKLNEPDLTSLCARSDLKICSPCGITCQEDFFPSSACTENADRVCTACSLCQSSSCSAVCKIKLKRHHQLHRLVLIVGSASAFFLLALIGFWGLLPHIIALRKVEASRKSDPNADIEVDLVPPLAKAPSLGSAQVFRLAELKDATNGFKEFNELGRGSYGFVYKALLPDGRHVAVKRANAATIINTNTKDFEAELDILCKLGHPNIVNLLGYCSEMGERLLVYEFMPRGTLHDHLHGGLSPLNWSLRLKIATQAARGLAYLHHEAVPHIVHRDVKTSNILLDNEWRARISDFGLLTPNDKEIDAEMKTDVYNFGIVLLEILSGRKAYDVDYAPPSIVEWALPLIRKGKAAALIDMYTALPRNVEPLLKLAEAAELALKEDPNQRPKMSELVTCLEQVASDGSIL